MDPLRLSLLSRHTQFVGAMPRRGSLLSAPQCCGRMAFLLPMARRSMYVVLLFIYFHRIQLARDTKLFQRSLVPCALMIDGCILYCKASAAGGSGGLKKLTCGVALADVLQSTPCRIPTTVARDTKLFQHVPLS